MAIWDVKIVLEYLSSLENVSKLDLKMLTLKLTMLLCLVTAQRSLTLHLLKFSNMISEGQNIIFTISDLVKQSSVRFKAPIIKLRPYADKALCVTTALHEYLSRSKDLRKQVDNLFISYARPHLAVTKNTSRWIKSMLETAGIIISIYKSHSIRAAASTAMKENSFPVEEILRTAGWSNVQTFGKFYIAKFHIAK